MFSTTGCLPKNVQELNQGSLKEFLGFSRLHLLTPILTDQHALSNRLETMVPFSSDGVANVRSLCL